MSQQDQGTNQFFPNPTCFNLLIFKLNNCQKESISIILQYKKYNTSLILVFLEISIIADGKSKAKGFFLKCSLGRNVYNINKFCLYDCTHLDTYRAQKEYHLCIHILGSVTDQNFVRIHMWKVT